ncbi:MAG TPA: ABC transporter substrate-binding protein [Clostridia bacterium]
MKKILTFLMVIVLSFSFLMTLGCSKSDFTVGIIQLVDHVALDAANKGFREELKDLLKEQGKTVKFLNKSAAGDFGMCTDIANNYVSKRVNLMLAIATPAAQAAASTTKDIPILFTAVTNPVIAELVESWDKPNTNLSGTSDLNPVEDQIKLIQELVPDVEKIAVLYTTSEDNSVYQLQLVQEYCEKQNIEVLDKGITESMDLDSVFLSLPDEVDAIYIPTDNGLAKAADHVHNVNKSGKKLPIVCGENGMNEKCGIATYGIDYYELGKQTAKMAYKILMEGADIKTMPVETANPEYITLTVNQTVASEIGFTIPQSILDKVKA